MKVLLVYAFGTSDLQGPDADTFTSMSGRVSLTHATDPSIVVSLAKAHPQHRLLMNQGAHGSWPILGDTLGHILESSPLGEAVSLDLRPILTDQHDSEYATDEQRDRDTSPLLAALRNVFKRLQLPRGLESVNVLEPWILNRPVDQEAVLADYETWFEGYRTEAKDYSRRFFQMTAGTPQMAFAASAFGGDPNLVFLYTPDRARTKRVTHPQKRQQQVTDQLVTALVGECNWAGAARALEQEGNGYTPLDDRPHPRADRIRLANAMADWSARRYEKAACHDLRAFGGLGARITEVSRVCAEQSRLRSVSLTAPNRLALWVDHYNKLAEAAVAGSPREALAAAISFAREWPYWAAATQFGDSWRPQEEKPRKALYTEIGQRLNAVDWKPDWWGWYYLLYRAADIASGPLAGAFDSFKPLQWLLLEVRQTRNNLEHGAADIALGLGAAHDELAYKLVTELNVPVERVMWLAASKVVSKSPGCEDALFVSDALRAFDPSRLVMDRLGSHPDAEACLKGHYEKAIATYATESQQFQQVVLDKTRSMGADTSSVEQALKARLEPGLAVLKTRSPRHGWNAAEEEITVLLSRAANAKPPLLLEALRAAMAGSDSEALSRFRKFVTATDPSS